jgi:drug/metabolite transporter (DMT)-like permease
MGVKSAGGGLRGALRLILLGHGISLVVLLAVCWAMGTPWPTGAPAGWAVAAGLMVPVALTAFYVALSRGAMGPSAAVSGLLAAAIPAAVSAAIEGRPSAGHLAGFVLAAAAIWAIAAGEAHDTPGTMTLAVIGGLGFGFYFVALRMANPLGVVEPMAIARATSVVTCGAVWLGLRRGEAAVSVSRQMIGWAVGVALLDTGGNMLFVAATRMGRLDVASVLASLYPAGTILLAAWRLHERPTRRQVVGMMMALVAVVVITL